MPTGGARITICWVYKISIFPSIYIYIYICMSIGIWMCACVCVSVYHSIYFVVFFFFFFLLDVFFACRPLFFCAHDFMFFLPKQMSTIFLLFHLYFSFLSYLSPRRCSSIAFGVWRGKSAALCGLWQRCNYVLYLRRSQWDCDCPGRRTNRAITPSIKELILIPSLPKLHIHTCTLLFSVCSLFSFLSLLLRCAHVTFS